MSETAHPDFDSYWPFISGVAAATALSGLVIHWSIFLGGLVLLLYSAVGWATHSTGLRPFDSHLEPLDRKVHILGGTSTAKMGMWVFLASEMLFFTGLIGMGIALRVREDTWADPGEVLNVPLTAANTFFLICSSMTMVEALRGAETGNYRRMKGFLLATLLIGVLFVSIQIVEYTQLIHHGFVPDTSTYASAFYVQTAFHGGHVSGGIIGLSVVTYKAFKGRYTKENHESIEMMGLYWHFVDVVWIFLFTIVYLI